MFTLERALFIDFCRRGKWGFLTTFVCAASLLLFIFIAIQTEGAYDHTSVEAVQMHVTFSIVIGFCAIAMAFGAQGRLTRFFSRPISTARLVICQLTFGMIAVSSQYLALAGVLNFVAGTHWPLWGPAIFFAVAMACVQAAVWWTEGSQGAQIIACTVMGGPLAVWFSRRYGAKIFGDWQSMWAEPTLLELGTLAMLTVGAYLAANFAVARNRRGEGCDFSPLANWFAAFFTSTPRQSVRFRSAWRAQLWFEWRQKLGGAPALLGLLVIAIIASRLFGVATSREMLEALVVLPMVSLLVILPLVYGLIVGNYGSSFKMTPLLATRPLSDAALAGTSLLTGGLALLLAWGVCLLGLAAGAGLCLKLDGSLDLGEWNMSPIGPWTYLGMLVTPLLVLFAAWANLGLVVSLTMTGRPYLLGAILGPLLLLAFAFAIATKELAPVWQVPLRQLGTALVGLLFVGTMIWIVAWTRRRRLVPERTTWIVLSLWFVLTATGISTCVAVGQTQLGWLLQIAGTCALVVLPFVSAPLALSWNRHR